MIVRSARAGDEIELESFDLGSVSSPWLDEVREIVSGLVAWQRDREHAELDRQVVLLSPTVRSLRSRHTNAWSRSLAGH